MRLIKFASIFALSCLWLGGCFGTVPVSPESERVSEELYSHDLICATEAAYMDVVPFGRDNNVDEGIRAANEKHGKGTCVIIEFMYIILDASVRTFESGGSKMALQKVLVSAVVGPDQVTHIAPKPFEQYRLVTTGPSEPKKSL